jgi:nucleotide-binding universal stress UspA family protein
MVRIEKILCPVDFFSASERAVDYAIALAKNYEARLILLNVVTPVAPASYELPLNTGKIIDAMTESATARLKKLAKRAEARKVPVETIVRVGEVDMEIREIAKDKKVDLITMGTHGRRPFERWILGSVTERLLRRVSVPMLTIGGKAKAKIAPPAIRRILVTTDFSEGTNDAIKYAFSIGQECQADVTLMHVVNDIDADISGRYRDPLIKSIRMRLEGMVPDEARDWCNASSRVETGLPYKRILGILAKEKFDLLVMNVHGKAMLDRALLGSTAERVVRGAATPVLLIPPSIVSKPKKRTVRKAA